MTRAPMSWQLEVSAKAQRDLGRLPNKATIAIIEFITTTLPTNPERMSKPLRFNLEGLRTARRGDYRVIIRLNYESNLLLVVRIAHRADVYRRDTSR